MKINAIDYVDLPKQFYLEALILVDILKFCQQGRSTLFSPEYADRIEQLRQQGVSPCLLKEVKRLIIKRARDAKR